MPPSEPPPHYIVPTGTLPVRVLVSIHDVMPETLDRVQRILDLCTRINPGPVTLLVVPGREWDADGIQRLHTWQDQGHPLAGHGWLHQVEQFGGLSHRLHGLFISRRVAEHLALDGPAIAQLIKRCHAWFPAHSLEPPTLYVPPAWAMGAIRAETLRALPFPHHEVLRGIHDTATGRMLALPLVGYEAKGPGRTPLIRLWNRLNRYRAKRLGWLRIGIHPDDLDLPLARDAIKDLRRYSQWLRYPDLATPTPPATSRTD